MIEEWRPVPKSPGYEASSLGRIRQWVKIRFRKGGFQEVLKLDAPIETEVTGTSVETFVRNKCWWRTSYGMIASAFGNPRPGTKEQFKISFSNRNEKDLRPENLRWVKRYKKYEYKIVSANRKLSDEQVVAILGDERRNCDIAVTYGVSASTICNIKAGKQRRQAR